ncbi:MAG: hypothetical protein AAF333_19080 [Planctomycetota bacterium]
MRVLNAAWIGIILAGLLGCGDSGAASGSGEPGTPDATTATRDAKTADAGSPTDNQLKQQELSRRLMALDFFSEQMWSDYQGNAGLDWLKGAAAEEGLKLDRVMPELVIEREGVAVRPVTLQATGDWPDLVRWLQAIEASPRRLVLREVKLHTLRSRVVADLKLAVMIDRPTGVTELAKRDVASLRGEELDRAVRLIEAELEGKSKAFTQLGADASWSQPIADLTALMPADSRPVTLSVGRYTNGQRAREFTGSFTLLTPDAGEVPGYVRQLQKQDGFSTAGLRSLRRAGADWQRATVTFSFVGAVEQDTSAQSGLAEVAGPASSAR